MSIVGLGKALRMLGIPDSYSSLMSASVISLTSSNVKGSLLPQKRFI